MFAQELTDAGQSLIAPFCIKFGTTSLGIDAHGPKFVDVERTTEASDTLLLEDGRSAVLTSNCDIAEKEKRREDNKTQPGNQAVDDALGVTLKGIHAVGNEFRV